MTPKEYIAKQIPERKELMTIIHNTIMDNNKRVKPDVSKMMGHDMIQYKLNGVFMYGLDSGKYHVTLHLLPMYGSPVIYAKYKKLLDKAKFQKGCINFTAEEQVPTKVISSLIKDCAKCEDMIIEMYMARKKKKK
jgi:hypothetical protein